LYTIAPIHYKIIPLHLRKLVPGVEPGTSGFTCVAMFLRKCVVEFKKLLEEIVATLSNTDTKNFTEMREQNMKVLADNLHINIYDRFPCLNNSCATVIRTTARGI
jgi:hypothetical protein